MKPLDLQIDSLCDQFEHQWQAGMRPRVEDILAEAPESARAELLRELLALELAMRAGAGESPTFADYASRFPEAAGLIEQLLAKMPPWSTDAVQTESISHDAETFATVPNAKPAVSALAGLPTELGDYVVLGRLGAGGMGQVFKAQHKHMKRLVAIKLLPPALTKDEAAVKRFQREVEVAARLVHPNIVQAYDASVQQGVWYLVMEYVEGRDLSALLAERGPLPIDEAIDYILQAARGLAYAHAAGLVHRDIKPANLMLVVSGGGVSGQKSGTHHSPTHHSLLKILDMGLARLDDAGPADAQLTNAGQVMGTVDYMAPEQAADTHAADARSDLYSLGCTLFRLLTNESVFSGETIVKKILAHTIAPIPALRDRRPDVPPELDRIYQRLLAKNPADRYQTAGDLIVDLERCSPQRSSPLAPREDSGGAKPAIESGRSSDKVASLISLSSRGARGPHPRRPLVAVAAGLLGLLLCYGVWVIIRDRDGKEVARMKVPDGGSAVLQTDASPLTPNPSPPEGRGEQEKQSSPATSPRPATGESATPGSPRPAAGATVTPGAPRGTGGTSVTPSSPLPAAPSSISPLPSGGEGSGVRGPISPIAADPAQPQLIAGDTVPTFSGLLSDPPAIPGIKRWNVETRYPRGPSVDDSGVAWSPDSKYLAVTCGRQLRIYTAPDLKLVRILPEHSEWIGAIAWSHDGQWLASVDNTLIRLHNPSTGEPGPVLKGHTQRVTSLAWTGKSNLLVSVASREPKNECVFVWSANGQIHQKLAVEIKPDPNQTRTHAVTDWIAVRRPDSRIEAWNAQTGQRLGILDKGTDDWSWSKGGETVLVIVHEGNELVEWDPLREEQPHTNLAQKVGVWFRVRPGTDQVMIPAGGNASHLLLNIANGKKGRVFETRHSSGFTSFSPDGQWLSLRGNGYSIHGGSLAVHALDDTAAKVLTEQTPRLEVLYRLAWNPRTDTIATNFDWNIGVWEFGTRSQWHTFGDYDRMNWQIQVLAWEPSGTRLASDTYQKNALRIWDASSGGVERTLTDLSDRTQSNAFEASYSADGKWFAASSRGGKIGLWDASTYQFKELLELPEKVGGPGVQFVASPPGLIAHNQRWDFEARTWTPLSKEWLRYSPDATLAIKNGYANRSVQIQDIPNGAVRQSQQLPANQAITTSGGNNREFWAAWSADSQVFAMDAGRGGIALFQRDGKFLRYLTGHNGEVRAAEFAPHGATRLAAACSDHTLRVWDVETGRQQHVGVQLSNTHAALLNERGEITFGDPAAVEKELIYTVQYDDGRTAILTPSQFKQLTNSAPPAATTPSAPLPTGEKGE